MMSNELSVKIKALQGKVRVYASGVFPQTAARIGLRFIDDNFRNQSWAGLPVIAWKGRKGKKDTGRAILVKKGALRRSFNAAASIGEARIFSNVVYAGAHNEGLRETVNIPAHTRKKMRKAKVQMINEFTKSGKHKTKTVQIHEGDISVSAHTRQMNIPRRQFAPTATRPSTVLTGNVKRQVTLDMMKILKSA